MIHLAIDEPKIEQFFNHSSDKILQALRFLAKNNIKDFNTLDITTQQLLEAQNRLSDTKQNLDICNSWEEIEAKY
jgi:hypothetical protein